MKNRRFMVVNRTGFHGQWGVGDTITEARSNYLKAGGWRRFDHRIYEFTSNLPFAPADREATDREADAYIDSRGVMCWVGCERFELA